MDHHDVGLLNLAHLRQAPGRGGEEAQRFFAVVARLVDYAIVLWRHESVYARSPALRAQIGKILLDAQAVRRHLGGVGHDEGNVHALAFPERGIARKDTPAPRPTESAPP